MAGIFGSNINEINSANDELERRQKTLTGTNGLRLAENQGMAGANSVGQNMGQATQQAAAGAGATKGEAAVLGQNAANTATQNAIASETEKAAQANEESIKDQEKKLQELEAEEAEKQGVTDSIGNGLQSVGSAALGAINPALGIAGAAAASAGRLGAKRMQQSNKKGIRIAGNVLNTILSDERSKVLEGRLHMGSLIKDDRLLHLMDAVEDLNEQPSAVSK